MNEEIFFLFSPVAFAFEVARRSALASSTSSMLNAVSSFPFFFMVLFHGASILGTYFSRENVSTQNLPRDTSSVPKLMKTTLFPMTSASILSIRLP